MFKCDFYAAIAALITRHPINTIKYLILYVEIHILLIIDCRDFTEALQKVLKIGTKYVLEGGALLKMTFKNTDFGTEY